MKNVHVHVCWDPPSSEPSRREISLIMDLNDLRKKLKFLLEEFQFIKSLKIWWSMADTVCHASSNFQ